MNCRSCRIGGLLSAEALGRVTVDVLRLFSILHHVCAITLDHASVNTNMLGYIEAESLFFTEKNEHICCMAHIINLRHNVS